MAARRGSPGGVHETGQTFFFPNCFFWSSFDAFCPQPYFPGDDLPLVFLGIACVAAGSKPFGVRSILLDGRRVLHPSLRSGSKDGRFFLNDRGLFSCRGTVVTGR